MYWCYKLVLGSLLVVGGAIASINSAQAQIVPDQTLPTNSSVNTQNNITTISGGTTAGNNLFHSFTEFSLPNGSTAYFNNDSNIQNIISRVTGSSVSNIDGLLKTNGAANLFLLNPNGIIFGPNAKLDIGGSFLATTANAIQFGSQGFFSAANREAPSPLLTVNPSALLFNQITTASIQNNSVAPSGLDPSGKFTANGLRVPDGQSLFLVGGNVSMNGGGLFAFGGRVELSGLAGAGTVGLNGEGKNLSLSFPDGVTRSDVSLNNGASVNVRADNGGSIGINTRNLESQTCYSCVVVAKFPPLRVLLVLVAMAATSPLMPRRALSLLPQVKIATSPKDAFTGSGGRIQINSYGIFGIQQRSREDLVRLLENNDLSQLDPQKLLTNDITAFSQTNSNLSGAIDINTLGLEPTEELINLPAEPSEPKLAQSCQPSLAQNQSSFIITGRGGLPANPREALRSNSVQVDWVALDEDAKNYTGDVQSRGAGEASGAGGQRSRGENTQNANYVNTRKNEIVEAQGWVKDAQGDIVLVAIAPNTTPHASWQTPVDCR